MENKAIKWFEGQTDEEQLILQILAFSFCKISSGDIFLIFRKLKLKYKGKAISYKGLTPLFKEAQKNELLQIEYDFLRFSKSNIPILVHGLIKRGVSLKKIADSYEELQNNYYIAESQLYCHFLQYTLANDIEKSHSYVLKLEDKFRYGHSYHDESTLSDTVLYAQKLNILKKLPSEWIKKSANSILWFHVANYLPLNNCLEIAGYLSLQFKEFVQLLDLLKQGKLSEILNFKISQGNYDALSIVSVAMWYMGQKDKAILYYDLLLKEYNKVFKKRILFFDNISAIFWLPIYLSEYKNKANRFNKYKNDSSQDYHSIFYLISVAIQALNEPEPYKFYRTKVRGDFQGLPALMEILCISWLMKESCDKDSLKHNKNFAELLFNNNQKYHAWELISYIKIQDENIEMAQFTSTEFTESIVNQHKPKQEWEQKLKSLLNLTSRTKDSNERLIWLIDFDGYVVQPVLQKMTKSGNWSAGRNVALTKIAKKELTCITDKDMAMSAYMKQEYWNNSFYFDSNAILGLVNHPLLFLEDARNVPIELVQEDIQLIIEEKKNECEFTFSHLFDQEERFFVDKLSTNKYCLYVANDNLLEIKNITGNILKVPISAKDSVLKAIDQLSEKITIQSSLIGENSNAKEHQACENLYAHFLPIGSGLSVELLVKPLNPSPPYLRPAEGLKKIITKVGSDNIWCERNFKKEQKAMGNVLESCPMLANILADNNIAQTNDVSDSLRVISELNKCPDITVEWPKGEKFAIKGTFGMSAFNMKLKKKNNWFEVSGNMSVDENTDINIQRMLKLIEQSNDRFIEIADGAYIELEKNFMRQLKQLQSIVDISKKEVKAHPLAMISAMDLFQNANLTASKEWKGFEKIIKKTEKNTYELPDNLEADLRPYQIDGYKWLSKLADWQSGACLADDMGLGKTVQCIAVLLSRKTKGPALVVAPSSVCRNWVSEIRKFAPSLEPILFGNGDRTAMVKKATNAQVLITSYGLLNTEGKLLTSRKWHTLILDEAHAIKNINTKRSQVVQSFEADFKIALTGTPLQNHLGELWNLFQFLNPGILGSQHNFNQRYVQPIERMNNDDARTALKNVIKPFMLRRLKNQVLDELPEKTEITMAIDLSDEERTFYEAMRLKSINEIQGMDDDSSAGEKQIKVLAEIMKLRRICCHPSLSGKDIPIESSKLARFEQLVDSLIDNNHKALVFSQFVDHLSIIKTLLDKKNIRYEYLDGSTSGKKREERIKKFQAGSADLFLISLKAGGVGLNLTAADYVIHMDPWWNPAVEDQASDRAHRIGQTRPVTIYRLVAKNTIEEKIVAMHKHKRNLAESLLLGTDSAHKITANELIEMLQQNI